METLSLNSADLIIWLGALIVWIAAMSRFNNPRILPERSSTLNAKPNWQEYIKHSLSWSPGKQSLLLRPPRANTTAFRYRLYQFSYALLALLIYLLILFQPDIGSQLQVILSWFIPEGSPDISNAGPLIISAFVVLIFPNVPPFRWADSTIRALLYERALIPAQQLREVNRLKMAPYNPPFDVLKQVREIAIAEGFDARDIAYDSKNRTTQSLWSKCLLLIEHIKIWEADDHYKDLAC